MSLFAPNRRACRIVEPRELSQSSRLPACRGQRVAFGHRGRCGECSHAASHRGGLCRSGAARSRRRHGRRRCILLRPRAADRRFCRAAPAADDQSLPRPCSRRLSDQLWPGRRRIPPARRHKDKILKGEAGDLPVEQPTVDLVINAKPQPQATAGPGARRRGDPRSGASSHEWAARQFGRPRPSQKQAARVGVPGR